MRFPDVLPDEKRKENSFRRNKSPVIFQTVAVMMQKIPLGFLKLDKKLALSQRLLAVVERILNPKIGTFL